MPPDDVMPLSDSHIVIVFDASTLILLARIDKLDMIVANHTGRVLTAEK